VSKRKTRLRATNPKVKNRTIRIFPPKRELTTSSL
jgi:hypothetical protein